MFKSNVRQQRSPNNPKAKLTAADAVRVDVESLIQTPNAQAHLKAAKEQSDSQEASVLSPGQSSAQKSSREVPEQDSKVMQAAAKGMEKYRSTLRELAGR